MPSLNRSGKNQGVLHPNPPLDQRDTPQLRVSICRGWGSVSLCPFICSTRCFLSCTAQAAKSKDVLSFLERGGACWEQARG